MLVITRRVDQGIIIQDNILITVLRVEGDRVRIGISAPQEITILRQELLKHSGNGEASEPAKSR
jgi:carbon storage regulator